VKDNLCKETKLKVELLRYTPNPEETVSLAAKLCYSSSDIAGLLNKINSNDQKSFIDKIVSIGHHSVLEHISFTFGVEGISRALTHQLVRHRVASYSQKSQRYVKHKEGFEYILPETIKSNKELEKKYKVAMAHIQSFYDDMLDAGIPAEDARYMLPNACETKIIITMNARELIHFFNIRCCNRAQWEIRKMAEVMLEKCLAVAPNIFKYAGPGCLYGPCPEKNMTCGKIDDVRTKYKNLLAKYDKLN
jgi:thymidylate synthase (FAD)